MGLIRSTLTVIILLLTQVTLAEMPDPTDQVIRTGLEEALPYELLIQKFKSVASERSGSKVDPVILTRFEASGVFKEPLYKKVKWIFEKKVWVIRKVVTKGTGFKVYGVASTSLKYGKWKSTIKKMDFLPDAEGRFLSGIPRFVIEGSKEHRAIEREVQAKKLEKARQQKALEKAQALRDKKWKKFFEEDFWKDGEESRRKMMEKSKPHNPFNQKRKLSPEQMEYLKLIKEKVSRNWREPTNPGDKPECEVQVTQGPGGIVLDVTFGKCPGTREYRLSVETAILKSDPLPLPKDPALLERRIIFKFKPDE